MMNYATFKKTAEVNKAVVDKFRGTEEGANILGSISAGELGRIGIGAAAGGAGAYLLAGLLHKKPSTKKRLLYTLAGMAGGGALTYAGMGMLTNDKGVSLRDSLRLSAAAENDPELRERLENVDITDYSKKLLGDNGVFVAGEIAGAGVGAMTGVRNVNKHLRNTNQALAEGQANAMDHMNRNSTWRRRFRVEAPWQKTTGAVKNVGAKAGQVVSGNRVLSAVSEPVKAMWNGFRTLFESGTPYVTKENGTSLRAGYKARQRIGGAARGGAKGAIAAAIPSFAANLIANGIGPKSRI